MLIDRRGFTLGGLFGLAGTNLAFAQQYPAKMVQIINPNVPGGVTDVLARILAQRLQQRFSSTFIVENRPGAGGDVGTNAVAKSAPDGHMLLVISMALTMKPSMSKKMAYDPVTDLTAISILAKQPHVIVARPGLAVNDLKEFVALAKANPGKLTYSSAGVGTPQHLGVELLCAEAGIKLTHVPYRGAMPAMTDLIGGIIDIFYATETSGAPHMASGAMKPLAVTGTRRTVGLPNVPTVAEQGFPRSTLEAWYGVLGPSGMPNDLVQLLASEIRQMAETQDYSDRLGQLFLDNAVNSPAEFKDQIEKEVRFWKSAVEAAGIQVED